MGPRAVYASVLGKQVGRRHSMEGARAASTLGQHSSVSAAAVPELSRPGWIVAVIQNAGVSDYGLQELIDFSSAFTLLHLRFVHHVPHKLSVLHIALLLFFNTC